MRFRFVPGGFNHATAPVASPRGVAGGRSAEPGGAIASVTLVCSGIAWVSSDVLGAAGTGPGVPTPYWLRATPGRRPVCSRPVGRDGGTGDVVFLESPRGLIKEVALSASEIRSPGLAIRGGLGTGVCVFSPGMPAGGRTARAEPAPTAV